MFYDRFRRPTKRWTAADWPFYKPGVNPVAASTPPRVLALAVVYLDMLDSRHPDQGAALAQLERELQSSGRNKWHRVSDCLIGLWDDRDHARIRITPAFLPLYPRRFLRCDSSGSGTR